MKHNASSALPVRNTFLPFAPNASKSFYDYFSSVLFFCSSSFCDCVFCAHRRCGDGVGEQRKKKTKKRSKRYAGRKCCRCRNASCIIPLLFVHSRAVSSTKRRRMLGEMSLLGSAAVFVSIHRFSFAVSFFFFLFTARPPSLCRLGSRLVSFGFQIEWHKRTSLDRQLGARANQMTTYFLQKYTCFDRSSAMRIQFQKWIRAWIRLQSSLLYLRIKLWLLISSDFHVADKMTNVLRQNQVKKSPLFSLLSFGWSAPMAHSPIFSSRCVALNVRKGILMQLEHTHTHTGHKHFDSGSEINVLFCTYARVV